MRVTKAIREYVEEEISKKYDNAANEIGKEYYDARDVIMYEINKIIQEASDKIIKYANENGYEYQYGYRSNDSMLVLNGSIGKKEIENKIHDERMRIRNKKYDKIKEVLFNLEMGETQKAELKSVLDSITIE